VLGAARIVDSQPFSNVWRQSAAWAGSAIETLNTFRLPDPTPHPLTGIGLTVIGIADIIIIRINNQGLGISGSRSDTRLLEHA
jgi:hypothetical protein